MTKERVLIMGAAGRDFHNFNMCFRDNPAYDVVAFTATQIPDIAGRCYPPELAGKLYPDGIPIEAEDRLIDLIVSHKINQVIFAYSDVSHAYVMHRASAVLAAGADFRILGPDATMLRATVPVVAISAVRTGSGKSQTTRRVAHILKGMGKKTVIVRHPMPYGDLAEQACQRFASYDDLERYKCTIEEREEYEPHLDNGNIVYAGVDYGMIISRAQAEADVLLWDGGNNDLPFFRPDVHIVVADPLRAGHEISYHPGEANARRAGIVVINKVDSARPEDVATVRRNIEAINPQAIFVEAASPLFVEGREQIRGKRVLVVEDGPTVTHGEMSYGAGYVAARKFGAAEIIDPRPYAVGSIAATYRKYATTGPVLPAMGYGPKQTAELEQTIHAADCDLVIIATPIDLRRLVGINKPSVRVRYELQEIGKPDLADLLQEKLA
jgi:predicted GTPase